MVAVAAVAMLSTAVMAELEVKPYGSVQYRLREQLNTRSDDDNSVTTMDYSNRLCWRMGLRAKLDDQLSLQFQIGNDWGAAENVNWNANNGPRSRVFSGVSLTRNADGDITGATLAGAQNLYVHLASFRWNPGMFFLEAGVVPLSSNGTLDLLESSLSLGRYGEAGFNGWGDMNNSLIGLKLGMPLVKEGVKVSAELFQTVINARTQAIPSNLENDPVANPASVLMMLTVPVDAGAFKVTPEITAVLNRNFNPANEAGDHEILVGFAGSFKVNDGVSTNFNFGYGMISNEASEIGQYGQAANSPSGTPAIYKSNGLLLGAGASIKAGPGNVQVALNYNSAVNTEAEAATKHDYVYTDLRYVWRLHKNFSVTPRYRTYTIMFPEANAANMELRNRFELIFDGSF